MANPAEVAERSVASVRAALRAQTDPRRAAEMSAYLKDRFPAFFGVGAPARRAATKATTRALLEHVRFTNARASHEQGRADRQANTALVAALLERGFAAPEREVHHWACDAVLGTVLPAALRTVEAARKKAMQKTRRASSKWQVPGATIGGGIHRSEVSTHATAAQGERTKMTEDFLRPLLAVFKTAVARHAWWDTVDALATKGVGAVVRLTVDVTGPPSCHASVDDVMLAWAREGWPIPEGEKFPAGCRGAGGAGAGSSSSGGAGGAGGGGGRSKSSVQDPRMWTRRAAILHQLKFKGATNTELLSACVLHNARDGQFFIQKAIAWALHEYTRTDEMWVAAFLGKHDHLFPGTLVVREAGRLMTREAVLLWRHGKAQREQRDGGGTSGQPARRQKQPRKVPRSPRMALGPSKKKQATPKKEKKRPPPAPGPGSAKKKKHGGKKHGGGGKHHHRGKKGSAKKKKAKKKRAGGGGASSSTSPMKSFAEGGWANTPKPMYPSGEVVRQAQPLVSAPPPDNVQVQGNVADLTATSRGIYF